MTKLRVSFRYSWRSTGAFEAVLRCGKAGVEEYWLLGDILMPGTGRKYPRTIGGIADYGSGSGELGRVYGGLLVGIR